MGSNIQQKSRIAELHTPLGADVFGLARLDAHEAMSEPFEFVIEAVSESENIDFDAAIGRNCAIRVTSYQNLERWFNGVLAEARWTGLEGDYYTYQFVLRPWFWLLDHTTDCRFFQEKTVDAIIRKVFEESGFTDYELKLSGSYPKMEYCVQYRETHFAFLSRLMEEHGIYYFFRHSRDRHVMVLADSPGAHVAIEGGGTREYLPLLGAYVRTEEHFHQWTSERRFRTGRIALNDYDFKKPGSSLQSRSQAGEGYAKSNLEVYDYPGRYVERGVGETFAKHRLDAEQALDHRRIAGGEVASIYPGGKTTLKGHRSAAENIEYLAVRAHHSVTSEHYGSTSGGDAAPAYRGSYVLQPASRPFRAPALTPKPLIHGIQTAKVVGEEGEEITVDEHGRIKVQFHWDRNKKQSCWIRVAEMWSGKKWGSAFHPRHGQEVVVDFLEGDPDRPLVVGTVYNGENTVPWALPAEKTKAGWKSDSTKGGGGFNEWRFEDKKGSEQVWLRAEKDLDQLVQHKETRTVGTTFETAQGKSSRITTLANGDDEHTVEKGDQKVRIGHDQTVDVANEITVTAGTRITLRVGNSTVVIDKTSIKISAMQVEVTGTASIKAQAIDTQVKADAVLVLQGGLVKIN